MSLSSLEPHLTVKSLVLPLNMEIICSMCTTPSADHFSPQPGNMPEEYLTQFDHSEGYFTLHTEIKCDVMYFIVILEC